MAGLVPAIQVFAALDHGREKFRTKNLFYENLVGAMANVKLVIEAVRRGWPRQTQP
jgi:hypothetical protein